MEKKIKEIDYERITTTPQLHKHRFLCFLFGHKKAVPMLNETDWAIFTKGCPRCGTHLGMPTTWKGCPPPPNLKKMIF